MSDIKLAPGITPAGKSSAPAVWNILGHTYYEKSNCATSFSFETLDPPALVVQVGSTQLRYQLRCVDDLHAMLKKHGDWVALGSADEQKPAPEGTVEAWGRAATNPVGGWYGLKKGLRGRFGMYVPPVLEALGLAEVEHLAKNNRMRAK